MTNDRATTPGFEAPAGPSEAVQCLACSQSGADVFFELNDVPVLCNAPCTTRDEALRFPKGQIKLAFCPHCGHLFNSTFSPELLTYNQQYENSLHYSSRFDEYIKELAAKLIDRFELRGKDIIEIGCGKGDFLALLCDLGGNRGVGFDPSFQEERLGAAERVRIVRDLYSEAYGHLACDLLCCRQTLEHIPDPAAFLRSVRRGLGDTHAAAVFFEVPNALYSLRHKGIWDIIYEHVSYFWSVPLSRILADCSFAVRDVQPCYGGQFLCAEAETGRDAREPPAFTEAMDRVAAEASAFAAMFRSTVCGARELLEGLDRRGQRAVVWGAGSKGVMFLNLLRDCGALGCAIDINPHKQGKYVPGTGHAIQTPDALAEDRPDVVLVMNPLYRQEIANRLAEMSIQAELIPV